MGAEENSGHHTVHTFFSHRHSAMNSETHRNDNSIYNANLNTRRHQPTNRDRQLQQQYVSRPRNTQNSSSATCNHDGLGKYSSCSCSHCDFRRHQTRIMEETARMAEVSRIEDTLPYLDSFPVGYRFWPTDKELVKHYLLKKVKNETLPENKIVDVDIYQNHPEKIVENYPQATEGIWYFFSSRYRKYANGKRPGRRAGPGYWKATGKEKEVLDDDKAVIGFKNSLSYHEGDSPNGIKTNWIVKEYVVAGHKRKRLGQRDMKLDDYVLYKMYKTKSGTEKGENENENENENEQVSVTSDHEDESPAICDSNQDENTTISHDERGQEQEQAPIRDRRSHQFENVEVQNFINYDMCEEVQVLATNQPVMHSNPSQAVLPNRHLVVISDDESIVPPRNHRFERNPLSKCYQSTGLRSDLLSPNMTYPHRSEIVQPPVPTPRYLPPNFQFFSSMNYSVLPPANSCYDATMDSNRSNPSYRSQPIQMTPQQAYNDHSVYSRYTDMGISLDEIN